MTRLIISRLWHVAKWLGRPLAYCGRHSTICQRALLDMPQPEVFTTPRLLIHWHITLCDGRDMPMVAQLLCEVPTHASRLDAGSKQNLPDLENLFLHRCMRYSTDRSFETDDF
jgi:hypothetical protein